MDYVTKGVMALAVRVGVAGCATPQQERLKGSVLDVPGKCLDYDTFDEDQHPDCRAILGRETDHLGGIDDFLDDVNVGAAPSPHPVFQGNNPYGMIKRLGVPDTLITPPSEWNERCYDTSLSNPNILTDGCGYHQGVDESQIEILLDYALPDETHKKPIEIKSEETRTGTTTQSITIIEHEE